MKPNSRILSDKTAYPDLALLILRLGLGGLMLLHGIGKLTDLLNGRTEFFESFDPFGVGATTMLILAVIAEFGCSILLILGVYTRMATIPLMGSMAMAFFVFHANDGLMDKELPLIYLIGFLALFLSGPGRFALGSKQAVQLTTKYELDD